MISVNKFFSKPISYFIIISLFLINIFLWSSFYRLNYGYQPDQPVEFSHKAHIENYDMKCTFCHYYAEKKSFAGVPSTWDCMVCHNALKSESEKMLKVIESADLHKPLIWNRVYKLPEFTYFNHFTHLRVMIDCSSCHGEVEKMEKVVLNQPLTMKWCLDCHRNPLKHIIPARKISGIYTDTFNYFENSEYKIIDIQELSNFKGNQNRFYKRLPNFGPENCSACHY